MWSSFKQAGLGLAAAGHWHHYSGTMELCLDRKSDVNLVQFHLAITDERHRHHLLNEQSLSFHGCVPNLVSSNGRGRRLKVLLNTLHYFCQAPKMGSVFCFTNYSAFTRCVVELSAIFNVWRSYRMEDDTACSEMRLCRGRGNNHWIQEVESNSRWRQTQSDLSLQRLVTTTLRLQPQRNITLV